MVKGLISFWPWAFGWRAYRGQASTWAPPRPSGLIAQTAGDRRFCPRLRISRPSVPTSFGHSFPPIISMENHLGHYSATVPRHRTYWSDALYPFESHGSCLLMGRNTQVRDSGTDEGVLEHITSSIGPGICNTTCCPCLTGKNGESDCPELTE